MDLDILSHAPFKTVYGFQLMLQIILGSTLHWASKSYQLYAIWVCLILWAEGAHFVVIPSVVKTIYGREAGTIYALLFSYTSISAILMLFIVKSEFGSDYESVFKLSALLSSISFVTLICFFDEKVNSKTVTVKK